MMGPFCPEQGTLSHETIMDLSSTDEKVILSGGDVGSEKNQKGVIKFMLHPRRCLFLKQYYKLLLI